MSLGSASPGSRTLGLYERLPTIKGSLPFRLVMSDVSAFFIVTQFNLDQFQSQLPATSTANVKSIQFHSPATRSALGALNAFEDSGGRRKLMSSRFMSPLNWIYASQAALTTVSIAAFSAFVIYVSVVFNSATAASAA